MRVTAPSTCPWLDHPVSGLIPLTIRPFRTRFRCAYAYRLKLASKTNSLTHYTKGTPSPRCPKTQKAPTACRHPVSGTVSPRSSRCFSPFPHGTGSLSVTEEYLGLEGGPPMFRQDGSCPALLKDRDPGFPYGAVTRYGPPFQTLPVPKITATGLVRFRSPLLTESRLMSFPPATEMFQFAGFASRTYGFSSGYPLGWVAPFGDPGINDRSHLPRAFRSVPRPSSPLSAKASTRCPYFALERHTQRQEPSRYQTRYRRSEPTGATNTLP